MTTAKQKKRIDYTKIDSNIKLLTSKKQVMGKYKIQKRRTSTKYRKRTSTRYRKGRVGDNLLLDYWNLLLDVNLKRRVKL